MAINFPDSPNDGDVFTSNGKKWIYGGGKWSSYGLAIAPDVLKVDSVNNRVGVNNLSPSVDLDVTGDAAVSGSLTVDGDLTISGNTTTLNTTELYVEDNKVTLNSGATGSATANAGIEVERGDDPNVEILWDESADAWKIATDFTVDTDTLHVDSTNNRVGIGTTSPSQELDVNGDIVVPVGNGIMFDRVGSDLHILYKETPGSSTYGSPDDVVLRNPNGARLRFQTNGTNDRMTIDASGNIGIGTTSPASPLHISSTAPDAIRIQKEGVDQISSYISFYDADERLGYIGFPGDDDIRIANESAAGRIILDTDGAGTALTVASSGNVGINDTTPSYKLDVNGDINATGDLRIGGTAIGEWQTWTPTFGGVSAQPDIIVGRYAEVNNTVFWAMYFDFNGAGTPNGSVYFDAPVPVITAFSGSWFVNGTGWQRPSNVAFYQVTAIAIGGNDRIYLYAPQRLSSNDYIQASDNVNATQPETWTSAGKAWITGYYGAA